LPKKKLIESKIIECHEVSLVQNNSQILNDINLTIYYKNLITIIGPSGSGKTSLLKLLAGLKKPSRGIVNRRQQLNVGYMPQKFPVSNLIPINAYKLVSLNSHSSQKFLYEIIEELEINHLLKENITSLSGGELQRVLLAKALAKKPDLLILDEPGQGMDINGQAKLYDIVNRFNKKYDTTVIMASHDLHLVMKSSSHVICLNKHICCEGSPEDISQNPTYVELFGREALQSIGLYDHHHDHEHGLKG